MRKNFGAVKKVLKKGAVKKVLKKTPHRHEADEVFWYNKLCD